MRVGVVRTQVPFVTGGAERHAASLCEALNRYGHEAVEITLPFKWYPGTVLADSILAAKLTDLSEFEGVPIDLMIGLKFPAYLARHPNKAFWILHQHRQAYDQWTLGTSDLLHDPDGAALRDLIHEEDRAALTATAHPVYANSRNVASRLETYLGLSARPLYHPPPLAERLVQGDTGDYLFAPGRINPSKRLDLILKALASAASSPHLVIAGIAENPAYQKQLHTLSRELGVADRVTWLGGIDDETLIRTYAGARAVVFVPQDEDYGYITLEAMLSGKPVITVTDSGGPLEFIGHEAQGLVVAPKPDRLGRAFDRIMEDPALAEKMGQGGLERYRAMKIGWENVVETLTGSAVAQAVETPKASLGAETEAAGKHSTRSEAVATLRSAVAPPEPSVNLPFASVADVLDAYVFDLLPDKLGLDRPTVEPGLVDYLGTHWPRFLTTLETLRELSPKRVLDVGVFPPLVFEALMANLWPGVEMAGLWEGPEPWSQHVKSRSETFADFDMALSPANSERDRWPFETGAFDLVLGMEILEHLALDPYFFFSEAARVLEPGGHILITTPNVTSHRGVWKVLNRLAPYSFGIFVPTGGVYGRHNREYAPGEVEALGAAVGFETRCLFTADVYDDGIDPGTAEMLVARDDALSLRGETIFYLGRKTGTPSGAPERFYHGDPVRMSGELRLEKTEPETGLAQLVAVNTSPTWWPVEGKGATCILAQWIDATGTLVHQVVLELLTEPVAPGAEQGIRLRLDPDQAGKPDGHLKLHLFQAGVGPFSGTGRAPALTVPCSQQAFLRLAARAYE